MSDLQRLFDRAVLDPRRELDLDAVIRRAGRLDRRARLARFGGGLAVLAVLVGSATFAATRPDTEQVTVGAEPTTTTATTNSVLAPADSETPAAGTCLPADGPVATVTLSPDVPQPRCVVVEAGQRLDLVNPGETARHRHTRRADDRRPPRPNRTDRCRVRRLPRTGRPSTRRGRALCRQWARDLAPLTTAGHDAACGGSHCRRGRSPPHLGDPGRLDPVRRAGSAPGCRIDPRPWRRRSRTGCSRRHRRGRRLQRAPRATRLRPDPSGPRHRGAGQARETSGHHHR